MAKVPFSKLQASVNNSVTKMSYANKAGEQIVYEVKAYLPIKEKLEVIANIVNNSLDENGFYNPIRIKLFTTLEVVFAYTNLSFTDKQKEDPFKLYDILMSTGIFSDVVSVLAPSEWEDIQSTTWQTIESVYSYKNSVMGILDNVVADYSNLDLEATEIQKKLGDPQNLELLRSILAKLG